MSSMWDMSADTFVTVLISVTVGFLAIAWLFAGRRRPAQRSGLEHRRLVGREAEDGSPEGEGREPEEETRTAAVVADHIKSERSAAPEWSETTEQPHPPKPLDPLVLGPARRPVSEPQPATPDMQTPRSAEQANAMSIAAALVRHDKREPAPSAQSQQAAAPEPVSNAGGDDLTVIEGIDPNTAKEMNDLGIRYFDQIAGLSPDHATWIESRLSIPITGDQRNRWIAQAKTLTRQTSNT